jgi:predicted AAA+ superfamily ATPase
MISRNVLLEVIADQSQLKWSNSFIPRSPGFIKPGKEIIILSGIRRCGKSTLLHEIRHQNNESDYYLNFDDERLIKFSVDDFQSLYELFIELYGLQHTFYFDEIQNIPNWERFVRRLYDYDNKIYITGSNASMLSRELGTHLTGRFIKKELYPFSFAEFITFTDHEMSFSSLLSSEMKAALKSHFVKYFNTGGFPEYIDHQNNEYLQSLYQSIFYRDVMVRNKITNEREFLELIYFLSSNIGKPFSHSSLAKAVNIQSPTTIRQYISYLEDTYLFFSINRFNYSLKKQVYSQKKGYFIDHILARQIGFRFSEDKGRALENIIFIELKRRAYELFYHLQKHECDFVARKNGEIVLLVQVTVSMMDSQTRNRELNGLVEAMEVYGLDKGLIITEMEEETITIENKEITVVPAWKWLLKLS